MGMGFFYCKKTKEEEKNFQNFVEVLPLIKFARSAIKLPKVGPEAYKRTKLDLN
jgi:hypothetical protein